MPLKNFIFFFHMYEMGQISKEGYKKYEVEIYWQRKILLGK